MPRYWTCHWQFKYWNPDNNAEGEPVCSSGSNMFRKRGVSLGDIVYVISLAGGQLYLGGRMTVKDIVSRPEAVKLWGSDSLYDADEWVVDPEESGTSLHLHRRLSPSITKQLRFASKDGPKEPFFISDTHLDNQATRGVRELTQESAELLDRIIADTDQLPIADNILTVTEVLEGQVSVQSEQIKTKDKTTKPRRSKQLLDVQILDTVAVVSINPGRISGVQVIQQFGDQLMSLVEEDGHHRILINCSKIEYLSSGALEQLVYLRNAIEEHQGKLAFSNFDSSIRDAFEVTGFYKVFNIFENEEDTLVFLQGDDTEKIVEVVRDESESPNAVDDKIIPSEENRIRFFDNALIRKIEEAAVLLITNELKSQGWTITSREHEANLGFDLECCRGSELMHLEVKGTNDSFASFNLQASQYEAASKNKHWKIAVVTNALHPENAKVTYYEGDTFLNSFEIDPLQYRASLKDA